MITGTGSVTHGSRSGEEASSSSPRATPAAAGLEEPDEEQEEEDGGRHSEDEEQLGAGDPSVGRGLAPRRCDLGAAEEPLGPEPRELLQRKLAHGHFEEMEGERRA